MQAWIALFRGIKVGENVVFETTAKEASLLSDEMAQQFEKLKGFRPQILVRAAEEFSVAVSSNPFPEAVAEPKTLNFFFLAEPAEIPDLEALDTMKALTESYVLINRVLYLHA